MVNFDHVPGPFEPVVTGIKIITLQRRRKKTKLNASVGATAVIFILVDPGLI